MVAEREPEKRVLVLIRERQPFVIIRVNKEMSIGFEINRQGAKKLNVVRGNGFEAECLAVRLERGHRAPGEPPVQLAPIVQRREHLGVMIPE